MSLDQIEWRERVVALVNISRLHFAFADPDGMEKLMKCLFHAGCGCDEASELILNMGKASLKEHNRLYSRRVQTWQTN